MMTCPQWLYQPPCESGTRGPEPVEGRRFRTGTRSQKKGASSQQHVEGQSGEQACYIKLGFA